jgi:SAM-dependent methyltransferase
LDKVNKTKDVYGFLWTKAESGRPSRWHCDDFEEQIGKRIVRGAFGIDAGSGCGFDTYIMAKNNPNVRIMSLDISDGVRETRNMTKDLGNVIVVKGSVLDLPVRQAAFDFAYSYGMLHHTPDPARGIREIARTLKEGAPVYLYLYEDHSENPVKYRALKLVTAIRRMTVKMRPRALYVMSLLLSPFIFLVFTVPAKILGMFGRTREMSGRIPFHFGTHPFSLAGDIYDRFSAPIEYRFSRRDAREFLEKNGFTDVKVDRIKSRAGWIVWGNRIKC